MNVIFLWIIFGIFVLGILILDLGVINRKSHVISLKEAAIWSSVWFILALIFNFGVYLLMGPVKATEFLTGYLLEESLSVDNIFVFILVFSYFNMAPINQPRILKWGIIGAIVMRGIMIFAGYQFLKAFHWMIYVFGGLLIITAIKLAVEKERKFEPERNILVKLCKKIFPVAESYQGEKFFVRINGILHATTYFIVLLVVESTDLIFAIDSVPAIFAITKDPFIVYTSNIFAIMGLRSLYFLLSRVMNIFVYLKLGLSVILVFIGIKMIISDIYPIPITIALAVVAGILTVSIIASLIFKKYF